MNTSISPPLTLHKVGIITAALWVGSGLIHLEAVNILALTALCIIVYQCLARHELPSKFWATVPFSLLLLLCLFVGIYNKYMPIKPIPIQAELGHITANLILIVMLIYPIKAKQTLSFLPKFLISVKTVLPYFATVLALTAGCMHWKIGSIDHALLAVGYFAISIGIWKFRPVLLWWVMPMSSLWYWSTIGAKALDTDTRVTVPMLLTAGWWILSPPILLASCLWLIRAGWKTNEPADIQGEKIS